MYKLLNVYDQRVHFDFGIMYAGLALEDLYAFPGNTIMLEFHKKILATFSRNTNM